MEQELDCNSLNVNVIKHFREKRCYSKKINWISFWQYTNLKKTGQNLTTKLFFCHLCKLFNHSTATTTVKAWQASIGWQKWELRKYKYFSTALKSIFLVSVLYLRIFWRRFSFYSLYVCICVRSTPHISKHAKQNTFSFTQVKYI